MFRIAIVDYPACPWQYVLYKYFKAIQVIGKIGTAIYPKTFRQDSVAAKIPW